MAEIWECDYSDKSRSAGARKMSSRTVAQDGQSHLIGNMEVKGNIVPKLPAINIHHSFKTLHTVSSVSVDDL